MENWELLKGVVDLIERDNKRAEEVDQHASLREDFTQEITDERQLRKSTEDLLEKQSNKLARLTKCDNGTCGKCLTCVTADKQFHVEQTQRMRGILERLYAHMGQLHYTDVGGIAYSEVEQALGIATISDDHK